MDQSIFDTIRNCYQTAYEIQTALSNKFDMGFKILMVHSVTDGYISEQDLAASRKDFAKHCNKLAELHDRRTQKYVSQRLEQFKTCAVQVRNYTKEYSSLYEYSTNCFDEFSDKQQGRL
ncbi:hypothetical protein TTHERM_00718010 (macronuclear) [Tetrahymena thermophila SB210]|uniref:Uncharacterized protein n=1 Tax=Tetrahymena thermophila (strain SB210) TaxID=312017 RepID=Q23E78_TETTS|nr:hypothetical protein TTHERM_00718010 [Tetrahymena thermophila SB210]EAR94875.1 hypothetical protein TTHERM_00718010 [Tetrahymena thermophila SB210]|eukprot:XP_001015120.1 hypothetical protein TTHERM_00718010 [Tetrahymena thermophila SB210]